MTNGPLPTAEGLIERLKLVPLPQEGGYYRQAWQSTDRVDAACFPVGTRSPHPAGTAIYFLVKQGEPTAVHRLTGTEVYHHYLGDPVRLHRWTPAGAYDPVRLGSPVDAATEPQRLVDPMHWQAVEVLEKPGGPGYALMGTTLAPGFIWEDVVFADEAALQALGKPAGPSQEAWVKGMSRG
jgi:predicted cupin superfamily sugar epimerase